jgi:glycosyltransferase involved in cell wall biosynthesis
MFAAGFPPWRRRQPDVTFGMIVRNGAASLRACLESIAPLCDELVVVDTGSSDGSREIARAFGASVIDAEWTNDFARARNRYVERARCAWILSLDADEVLGRISRAALVEALDRHPRTAFLFDIRNHFPAAQAPAFVLPSRTGTGAAEGTRSVVSRTIRLFPRHPGLRCSYPVHESLLPRIRRTGLRVRRCAVPIDHFCSTDPRRAREKAALYRDLGRAKIARYPAYVLAYLELGELHLRQGDLDDASRLFAQALALAPGCVEAHCYSLITLIQQRRIAECRAGLARAARLAGGHPDLRYVLDLLTAAERRPRSEHAHA